MRGRNLSDIIKPWIETLDLPGKIYTAYAGEPSIIRGESHWYTMCRPFPRFMLDSHIQNIEDWVMTVRQNHVEVRNEHDPHFTIIGWKAIDAADPEFFTKLEKNLRSALAYLVGAPKA